MLHMSIFTKEKAFEQPQILFNETLQLENLMIIVFD